MGVHVAALAGNGEGVGDIRTGLVRVKPRGAPPGLYRGSRGWGGDGDEEISDDRLLGGEPEAIPDKVDADVGGEDRAHVVFHFDRGGDEVSFGEAEGRREGGGGGKAAGKGGKEEEEEENGGTRLRYGHGR